MVMELSVRNNVARMIKDAKADIAELQRLVPSNLEVAKDDLE